MGGRDDDDYIDQCVDDEEDELEAAMDQCGSRRHGQCDLAGTEWCDWSCPFSARVFSHANRRRKDARQGDLLPAEETS